MDLFFSGGLFIREKQQRTELSCGFWNKLPTKSSSPSCFHCLFQTKPTICELPWWLWRVVHNERAQPKCFSWCCGGRTGSKWWLCGWSSCIWDDWTHNLQHCTTCRCVSTPAKHDRRSNNNNYYYFAKSWSTICQLLLLLDLPFAVL